ncbi:hypothetical protein [Roseibium aggregatum]|uniref:Uncharacterized protein n=1 Tax=Roseibium aggregatum TaxID=187304 RepID=A0A939EIF2_9HYPH|nr:hypothetical protein [Roseibium aggregatum]MBN9673548.1 hypothetical protein [Roseibium aggregatum]
MQKTVLTGALLLISLTGTAFAECNPAIVTIREGQQPRYSVPDKKDLSAAEQNFGAAPGADHVLVVDSSDGAGYWIARDRVEDAVFLLNGAPSAFRYSGPDHCAPGDLPIGLNEEQNQEIPLFLETSTGLQPRNGLWRLQMGTPETRACPEMMRMAMGRKIPVSLSAFEAPRPLKVSAPFHPGQLDMSQEMKVDWQAVGDNTWRTQALQEVFSQLPQNGGMGSELIWELKVLAEDKIRHSSILKVVIPAEAATALGGDTCIIETVSHWVRVGN